MKWTGNRAIRASNFVLSAARRGATNGIAVSASHERTMGSFGFATIAASKGE